MPEDGLLALLRNACGLCDATLGSTIGQEADLEDMALGLAVGMAIMATAVSNANKETRLALAHLINDATRIVCESGTYDMGGEPQ